MAAARSLASTTDPSAFFPLLLSLSRLITIFAPGSYRCDRHACLSMKKSNFLAAYIWYTYVYRAHIRIDAFVFESKINFIRSLHFDPSP